ncbi:hypothetical protein F4677DRAFT_449600 [Hypoxylon crocopeplum]|nr:hypothetical protein F4677DRAFT_449600 [Hypoxylon crocopeplum]
MSWAKRSSGVDYSPVAVLQTPQNLIIYSTVGTYLSICLFMGFRVAHARLEDLFGKLSRRRRACVIMMLGTSISLLFVLFLIPGVVVFTVWYFIPSQLKEWGRRHRKPKGRLHVDVEAGEGGGQHAAVSDRGTRGSTSTETTAGFPAEPQDQPYYNQRERDIGIHPSWTREGIQVPRPVYSQDRRVEVVSRRHYL